MQNPFCFTKIGNILCFPSGSNRKSFDNIFYIFCFTEDIKLVTDFSLNYRQRDNNFIPLERFFLY